MTGGAATATAFCTLMRVILYKQIERYPWLRLSLYLLAKIRFVGMICAD